MINVTMELYGVSDVAAVMETISHRLLNLKPMWHGTRASIITNTQKRFNKQGELDGGQWQPLHPLTRYMRERRGSGGAGILNESGKLKSIFDQNNSVNLRFEPGYTGMRLTVKDSFGRYGASLANIQQWSNSSGAGYRKQKITEPMRWELAKYGVSFPKNKHYLNHPNRRFFLLEREDRAYIGVILASYLTMNIPVAERRFLISGIGFKRGFRLIVGRNMTTNQKYRFWQKRMKSKYVNLERPGIYTGG